MISHIVLLIALHIILHIILAITLRTNSHIILHNTTEVTRLLHQLSKIPVLPCSSSVVRGSLVVAYAQAWCRPWNTDSFILLWAQRPTLR